MSGVDREPLDTIPTDEVPLLGGNVSTVVRSGHTVRRSTGLWTPAVHAWLRHLEAVGFDGAPRALGIDEQGREILTYFDGDVFPYPMPDYVWSDDTLASVAGFTRRLHDAAATFVPPPDAAWRRQAGAPPGPVICHNDIAPYNTVFRKGRVAGFIDWDFSAPGPGEWDLAWIAWHYVPLYEMDGPPLDRPRRLRLLADEYGLPSREALLPTIAERQRCCIRTYDEFSAAGDPAFIKMVEEGHRDGVQNSLNWLQEHWEELARAL
ncbi:MAG TPA: aminoglycoside phosphotransferase family protein [Chloroflexota bacterium]|nr:aminoglycoside phosphotransferase family protein [Chloroflexota bacterium]